MRDLPLTLLRALAAVYETGGVRPAGRRLGVQHSAISRALKDLEAWVQAPLYKPRTGAKALAFTAEGEALAKEALAALTQLDLAVARVREGARANTVTIATTPSFAMRWLLPRLPAFQDRHPSIELSVIVDQATRRPSETGADLNVRMGKRPAPALAPLPLMTERLFPVLGPRLWDDLGRPREGDSLRRCTLLHDRDPSASWASWRSAFGPADLDVRHGPRLTSSDLVLRAAEQNQGATLARARLAADSLAQGALIRPFGDQSIDLGVNYWILLDPDAGRRDRVQRVVAWLQDAADAATPGAGSEEMA